MSEANNITFAQAKTSFFLSPESKRKYNTLHLAGKEVCKKDEVFLVLFELNIKLLYGRYTNAFSLFVFSAYNLHSVGGGDFHKRLALRFSYRNRYIAVGRGVSAANEGKSCKAGLDHNPFAPRL